MTGFAFRSLLAVVALSLSVYSQQSESADLQHLLARATERSAVYIQTFRNLIANEVRTVEIFKEDGSVRKKRQVRSTFIVYQLLTDDKKVVEFRYITAVDGKTQDRSEQRAQDFFERVSRSADSREELDRIRKESFRYEDVVVDGYTLFQGVPLFQNLRDVMSIQISGTEKVGGRDAHKLSYQQTLPSPFIRFSGKDDKGSNDSIVDIDVDEKQADQLMPRLRGTLWIDKETLDIVKEVREITAQPSGVSVPMVVSRAEFEYSNSSFGIHTPRRIELTLHRLQRASLPPVKESRVLMEYGGFSQPNVEVKSGEVKN